MARKRKDLIMPHLIDCGGDLKKKWYVEYSIRNPETGILQRIRHYEGINHLSTYEERNAAAKGIIRYYKKLILSGTVSYKKLLEYEDLLLYDGQCGFSTKRTAKEGHIKIYLSEFLQLKKMEVNVNSFRTYQSELRTFLLYLEEKNFTDKPVSFFTTEIITDFLRFLVMSKGLSRMTVRKYEELLHAFFNYLKTKKAVKENPVFNIPKLGVIKDEAPSAIPDYMRTILKNEIEPKDPQLWMFICFIYYMAIRPGHELRLMRLNQINYSAGTVVIHNYDSKNKTTAAIDIPDQLYDLIVNKWKLQTYDQSLFVFGKYGEPGDVALGKNNMKNRHTAFRKKTGLPDSVKLYSWKHSGAQELASKGASIYEIQRHLRHNDITTTEKYLKKRIGQRSNTIKHSFPEI